MFMSLSIILVLVASVALNVWLFSRRRGPAPRQDQKGSVVSIIRTKMQDVNEMISLRSYFQAVASDIEPGRHFLGFKVPETGRKFLAVYSGEIVCGCDLSQAEISERFDVNRIEIRLPHSRILDIKPDLESIRVYHQEEGWFAPAYKLDDQNTVLAESLKEMRDRAVKDWDLLARSDENARRNLVSLIATLGMEANVIFFDEENKSENKNENKNRNVPGNEEPRILTAVEPDLVSIDADK